MTRIWAIGASVRALAQSLGRAGFEPIAADQFCDRDLAAAHSTTRIERYPHDLLRIAETVDADGFVYTGGLENEPALLSQLRERLPLWGVAADSLRRVRDVGILRDVLTREGFAVPETLFARPDGGLWLRKSQRSSGGLRIELSGTSTRPLQPGEYYQRFVDGECYGVAYCAGVGACQLLGVTRQMSGEAWLHAPAFHYCGSIGPVALAASLVDQLVRLGERLTDCFQLRGWFGVDVIVDRTQQLFVLEVNPRYTASMEVLERATGLVAAMWHVRAYGVQPQVMEERTTGCLVGKAVLYAPRRFMLDEATSNELLDRAQSAGDLADIPWPCVPIDIGQPVLTIFSEGATVADVEQRLREQAGSLYASLL